MPSDAERLNAQEEGGWVLRQSPITGRWLVETAEEEYAGDTPREALDAAMHAQQPAEEFEELRETCSNCGYAPSLPGLQLDLVSMPPRPGPTPPLPVALCFICRSTLAGRVTLYPGNSIARDHGPVLQTLAYLGNMLLDAIALRNGTTGNTPA